MSAQDVCRAEVVGKTTLRVERTNCPKGNLDVILKSGSCWKMLKVKEKVLIAQLCLTLVTPWT